MSFLPKVSIIVPIYNASNFIEQCIQTILNQSYHNIELILINDGSKDNSKDICEKAILNDQRAILYNQVNQGVSTARNKGIELATGDFILFIDADDYIGENYVSNFITEDLDILTFKIHGYTNILLNGTKTKASLKAISYSKDKIVDIVSNGFLSLNGYPFSKLYSTNVIKENNLSFDKGVKVCEDVIFNLNYIQYVNKIVIEEFYDYYYIEHINSSVKKLYQFKDDVYGYFKFKEAYQLINPTLDFVSVQKSLGVYLLRTLLGIYKLKTPRKERINNLNILNRQDINFVLTHTKGSIKYYMILLLKNRYLIIFDFLMKTKVK